MHQNSPSPHVAPLSWKSALLALLLASAQTTPEALALQPLQIFIQGARSASLTLRTAQSRRTEAEAQRQEQFWAFFPRLTGRLRLLLVQNEGTIQVPIMNPDPGGPTSRTQVVSPHTQYYAQLQLDLPVVDVVLIHRLQAAQRQITASEADVQAAHLQIQQQVAQYWFRLLQLGHALRLSRESEQYASSLESLYHRRLATATATADDEAQAHIQRLQAHTAVSSLERDIATTVTELQRLTGVVAEMTTLPELPTAAALTEARVEDWVSVAGSNPRIRAAQGRHAVATERARENAAQLLPRVLLTAGGQASNLDTFTGYNPGWGVGITGEIVLDPVVAARSRTREAQVNTARLEVESIREETLTQIRQTHNLINELKDRLTTFERICSLEQQRVQQANIQLQTGSIDASTVLVRARAQIEAELNRIQTASQAGYSRVLLRLSAGRNWDAVNP